MRMKVKSSGSNAIYGFMMYDPSMKVKEKTKSTKLREINP